jgi:hypothetical protein
MGVCTTKEFSRFARKAALKDGELAAAAAAVAAGRWDADLGGSVFKQRIAREGAGKSSGFRTIILFKLGGHHFFVHGFAKNEKANVTPRGLKALKALAGVFLNFDAEALRKAGDAGEISQVGNDGEENKQDR